MKGDTLFINISSDEVIISDGEINIFLDRNDVEKVLGPKLVQLVSEGKYSNIIIINGPGGFTNLRVGTLCLNILNTLVDNQINLYNISKVDLYKIAYKNGILQNKGIIYIGQKRNIWLWDFEKGEKVGQYSFDELKEIINYPIFLDEVVEENYYPERLKEYNKVKISFNGEELNIESGGKSTDLSLNNMDLKPLKSVAPNYMMEPSITLK